jgi:hypothetical protein
MCLLLLGACSSTPQKVAPIEACEPTIEIQKLYVPLPGELTQLNDNPAVPDSGDNAALLEWAMSCAVNHRLYENQMRAIRDLQR